MKAVSAFVLSCITWGQSSATNPTDCGQVDPSKPCHESREESARVVPYPHEDSDESSTRVVAGHLRGSESIFDKDDGAQGNLSGQKRRKREKSGCLRGERVECNAFDNEFGNVFRKKILLCHYQGGDRHKTLCIAERSMPRHLKNHPNDYCGECVDATTTSTTAPPPICNDGDMCTQDDYDTNGLKCVFTPIVCDEGDVCDPTDGICKWTGPDQFVTNSVFTNITRAQGIEDNGDYEIVYDVEYNKAGIVSLGRSSDVIEAVSCLPGSVKVLFSKPIPPERMPAMFPHSATLLIDGEAFGTDCNVHDVQGSDENVLDDASLMLNVGVLLIESANVEGSVVTIRGIPTILDMIFEHQTMSYRRKEVSADSIEVSADSIVRPANNTRRELQSLDVPLDIKPPGLTFPKDFPVQVSAKVEFSGAVTWHYIGIDTHLWSLSVEYSMELGLEMDCKFEASITMSASEEKTLTLWEKDLFPPMSIPYAGVGKEIKLPSVVQKVFKKLLDKDFDSLDARLGFFFRAPLSLDMTAKIEHKAELKYETTIPLLNVTVPLSIKGSPIPQYLGGYIWVDWDTPVENKRPSEEDTKPNPTPGNNNPIQFGQSLSLSFDIRFGFKPQIMVALFGTGHASIGTYFGFKLESKAETAIMPPVQSGVTLNCDNCHHLESVFKFALENIFGAYRIPFVMKKEEIKPDLVTFEVGFPLFTFCLLENAGYEACGDKCCDPNQQCIGDGSASGNGGSSWGGEEYCSDIGTPPTPPSQNSTTTTTTTTAITLPPPALAIEALDPTVITGGLPNTLYDFNLKAENIPTNVNTVRFEWIPSFGASDDETVAVVDETAATTIQLTYATPGYYTLEAFAYDEEDAVLASDSLEVHIKGTTLTIDPPALYNAEAGVEYTFDFNANEIPPGVDAIKFVWSFGMGASGTGESQVSVSNGEAHSSASVTYANDGGYGLTVEVQDASNNQGMAVRTVLIIVGDVSERNFNLTACDHWEPSKSGGYGTHVDSWNIPTDVPTGAAIDFRFNAISIPDKFIFEYPPSNLVLDTGWRGSASHAGPLYPGGITSGGRGEVEDVAIRLMGRDKVQVTVVGPDTGTRWDYSIRCRIITPPASV